MKQQNNSASIAMRLSLRVLVVSFVALPLLSACGSDSDTSTQVAVPVVKKPVKRDSVPEDPTAKMARAVVIGKTSAPVELKYELLNLPVVGEPVGIEIALIPTRDADSMAVSFAGSTGLTLSATSAPNIDLVKTGQPSMVKFEAKANSEDVFYVTVTATMYTAGTSSVRTFAVPLIVSAVPPPTAAEASPPTQTPAPATQDVEAQKK